MRLNERADLRKQAAADEVTVHIVDALEVIKIHEEERERLVCGELQLLFHAGVQVPRVEEAGAVVGDGELVDALHVRGVADGDGGEVAEDAEELDGGVGQQVDLGVEQLDDADDTLRGAHRNACDGADGQAGMLALELDPLGLDRGVRDDHGIAGKRDPAGDAFAHGDTRGR